MSTKTNREELVSDLRAFADELGKTPTVRELSDAGPHSPDRYRAEFGSWNEALAEAGFEPNLIPNIPREDVVADVERVAGTLGKTPTLDEMDRHGRYSRLTYQRKLGSYVETLERLGLEPSVTQYNFSRAEKPADMRWTANVRKLRADGPTPASDLPGSVGAQDKRYGLTKFTIKSGQTGRGQSETVYYLFEEHDPEVVVREFLRTNPQVLETRTRKAIVESVGRHGRAWSGAVRVVLDELEIE